MELSRGIIYSSNCPRHEPHHDHFVVGSRLGLTFILILRKVGIPKTV